MSFELQDKEEDESVVGIRAPRRMCRNRRLGGQANILRGVKDIEKESMGVEKFLDGARSPSAMSGPVRELRTRQWSQLPVTALRMLTLISLNNRNRKVLYYEGIRWDI